MTQNAKTTWDLFTDGACLGNPGPGGWACLLKNGADETVIEQTGGVAKTTNNRMELTAVIQGLDRLKSPAEVRLWTDSKYVAGGLTEWLAGWKRRGWRKADKKPVLNADLWQRLDELAGRHHLEVHWVRGHAGHPENERCDALAVAEAEKYRDAQ